MQKVIDAVGPHFDQYVADLKEFLEQPSVSTREETAADVAACADWLAGHLRSSGFTMAEVVATDRHPIVRAEHIVSPDLPTILAYGHYDVQPAEPLEKWTTPPFEPAIRDGNIYARGAVDDKGQMMMIVKAVEAHAQAQTPLPVNIRAIFEGEEEIGSPSLEPFIRDHRDWLTGDALLVCDTALPERNTPAITVALRGMSYLQVDLRAGRRDMHSGAYGGAAVNVLHVLGDIISRLHDEDGRVTIPGFYDNANDVDESVRKEIARLDYDEDKWREASGGAVARPESGYTVPEVTRIRPCIDVNGVWGGYTGDGAKTVIPYEAHVKLSARLVNHQDPIEIYEKIKAWVEEQVPAGLDVSISLLGTGKPVEVPSDSPPMQAARRAMHDSFGSEPLMLRGSGSIPVVAMFADNLKTDTILMGFGLNSDGIHAPDECFGLDRYRLGIETAIRFLHHCADLKSGV